MKFDKKIAVVTGGNSGIGLASARRLVEGGARVVLFGRNQETLDAAVAELGEQATAVRGDVARLEDLDRLYETIAEMGGGIDVLFVNAGVARTANINEVDEQLFDSLFDINVKGAFFTIKKALPLFNQGASVVLTGSVADQLGTPGMSVYSATKSAVRNLARSMSAELLESGVRVNVVTPGPIETPIFGRLGLEPEQLDVMAGQIIGRVPMQRMGQADEVARAVEFLSSADSSYMCGSEVVVDGGMSQI